MSLRPCLGPKRSPHPKLSSTLLGAKPTGEVGTCLSTDPGKLPCSAPGGQRKLCTTLAIRTSSYLGAPEKQILGCSQLNSNPGQPPPPALLLGSPVAVLVQVGVPSSSSSLALRPRELASLPGPLGALNSPLLGAELKRWKKDVYKLLKGKRKKSGRWGREAQASR